MPVKRQVVVAAVVAILAAGAWYYTQHLSGSTLPEGFASSNGRIEATEIDISTKTAGRLREILVSEGEFVKSGQTLAQMDTDQLMARKRQAEAELQRATIGIDTAKSIVAQREAERASAIAVIAQRQAQLEAATTRLTRSEQLVRSSSVSQQVLDDDRATEQGARAAVSVAQASQAASEAAISAARAQVVDAEAAVNAARAAIDSIDADITDSTLRAPRDGRIQYRISQPGEVLAAGGRVLNLVDSGDVYMTFFLPTIEAGRIAIGSEARIVLDAIPQYVIPASVSFVADVAQFTPKTVETEEERLKLTFRIRARINPDLLQRYIEQVKTGLPGMAYVRLDPSASWPENLEKGLVK